MNATPRAYLDTNVIIGIVERASALSDGQKLLVNRIQQEELAAVTSELTLMECLVKPLTDRDTDLIRAFLSFLSGESPLPLMPIDRDILMKAARIRGETGMKLPDSIHLSTAQIAQCTLFISNDMRLLRSWPHEVCNWSTL